MYPLDLLESAIEQYKPKNIIALFSGGHDSLVATHLALCAIPNLQICHLDTGIGVEETRDFARETVRGWDRELLEYKAAEYVRADGSPDPQIYDEMVKEYGFPGPAQHTKMYNRLKERPLRMMIRELDRNRHDITMLITGVRSQESRRRMGNVEPIQEWEGTKVWVAPIHGFSGQDVTRYINEHDLRRNLYADLLGGSKECLCGAFAHKGELEEIEVVCPAIVDRIRKLEVEVKARGFPWGWGEPLPDWWQQIRRGQLPLPTISESIICSGCSKKVLPLRQFA